MRVAFITRSTLYAVPGGDTVQIAQTASHLGSLGITADIKLSNEQIDYENYDLLHFFNITRPADILFHSTQAHKPYVISTILCSYAGYDKYHRKRLRHLFSLLSEDGIEYMKTIARWLLGKDKLMSPNYPLIGQRNSIKRVLNGASIVLPNSQSEYSRLAQTYGRMVKYIIVPNGVNPNLFSWDRTVEKDDDLVLCVARIEGIKNQLNLIKALNGTRFKLLIIGKYAPNHEVYYRECQKEAAENVTFINHLPQHELVEYYQRAKVHVLPSWFETTGLSSVEAAAMGCNVVVSDKGDVKEYFENDAFYCQPASPESILAAVEKASEATYNENLRQRILKNFTWQQAAQQTFKAYQLAIA